MARPDRITISIKKQVGRASAAGCSQKQKRRFVSIVSQISMLHTTFAIVYNRNRAKEGRDTCWRWINGIFETKHSIMCAAHIKPLVW